MVKAVTSTIPPHGQGAAFVTLVGGATDAYPLDGLGTSTTTASLRYGLNLQPVDSPSDYEVIIESIIMAGATSAAVFPYDAVGLDEGVTVTATTMDINMRVEGGIKITTVGGASSVTVVFRIQLYPKVAV